MSSTHTERTGTVVIGAGIVGLAVAELLSRSHGDIALIERHDGFGREASSRNSQVIHAGIYYPEDSLKARLCVRGNQMMYEFCAEHGIRIQKTGKLIPGLDNDEALQVHNHLERGQANGAPGLRLLSSGEIAAYSHDLQCSEALLSPSTGILDAHGVMAMLERLASSRGVLCTYGATVKSIDYDGKQWNVFVRDADGEELTLEAEVVINAAGLSADSVAETAGFDPEARNCRQMPAKGEFFRVAEKHRGRMNILVYPAVVPHMIGTPAQGVHLVLELDGGMKIGPNMMPGIGDYSVDPDHLEPFWMQMRRYLPWLEQPDLRPESAGIRAVRAGRTGDDLHEQDFYINEESDSGLPGLVNLIAMESPALTSCLAIAEHVESLLR